MLSESVPARQCQALAGGLRNARRAGRSRLPARAWQWQAGSGEAGGNPPKDGAVDAFNYEDFWT